jgi:uncharacterized protein YkwD
VRRFATERASTRDRSGPLARRPITLAMTRSPSVYALLAVLAAGLAAAPGRAEAAARLSRAERALIRQINDVRADHGLGRVRASGALSRAADSHSRDMLRRDFFDHTSSDGTPFEQRIRRYVDARMVGENLAAIGQRRGGAGTIVRMWMNSPGHRAVLLSSDYRRIGIARRWGKLGSTRRAVVTADFAS